MDATKAYMSTQGKGNFTFKILKNGAQPDDVNDIDGEDSLEAEPARVSTADLDQVGKEPRLTGPGARASRQTRDPNFDVAVTGREKKR